MSQPLQPQPGTEYHLAAKDGDVAKLMQATKKDLLKSDGNALTPLHWAAWSGNSETVKLLVSKGADPDKQDKDGNTPVHLAAAHGNISSLKVLLEVGASIWSFNDNRENPSQIAIKYNKGECFRFLDTLGVRMELTNKYLVDKLKTRALRNYEKRLSKRTEANVKAHAHLRKTTTSSFRNKSTSGSSVSFNEFMGEKSPVKSSISFKKISEAIKGSSESKMKNYKENFYLMKADEETKNATMEDTNVITFGELEAQKEESLTPTNERKRRTAPQAPVNTIGLNLQGPRLQDSDKEYDEFILPLMLRPTPISTFLTSNKLESIAQLLLEQQIDLQSLSLCSEDDLQTINVPLGPRKKIFQALENRKRVLLNPGPLSDSVV